MNLTDPLIAHLAVPVLVTIVVAVLVRLIGGSGTRAASIGLPVGVIAAYAILPGWPWAPPTAPLDQIAWLVVGGALAGLGIDITTRGRMTPTVVGLFWPALAIAYLVGFEWPTGADRNLYRYGEASVVLGLLLARMEQIRDTGISAPVGGAVVAAGLGAVAWASGLPQTAMLGFVLAAAGLGWVVCNWPNRRLSFGAAGLLGWGGAVMALAAHMALSSQVNGFIVLIVLLGLVVEPLARGVVAGNSFTRAEAIAPLAIAVLIAIPAAIAVALVVYAPRLLPVW
jgi:hypothetical protein